MVEFFILGPLEARDEEGPIDLGGSKQRAVLAVLLLSANRTVSRARLVDEIWGEAPPETADKMVQVHVSQLRKVLPEGTLKTQPPGYRIELEREQLDLLRFQVLADAGRSSLAKGDAETASELLSDSLSLWRGPALDEFSEPFTLSERTRLEELHLSVLEARITADLELGRHADLVAELESITRRHPLREGIRAQQMIALYRSGRQAEALAAYRQAKLEMDVELGIQPSGQLRDLEGRILRQEASLLLTSGNGSGGPDPKSTPTRRSMPRQARVQYASNQGINLAYQVFGNGPIDLLMTTGWVLPMEMFWDDPDFAAFLERLGSFARVILWDKRGTGLSDRVAPGEIPTLGDRVSDLACVLDAAESEQPAIFGISEGVPLAIEFAAHRSERVSSLVVYGGWVRTLLDEDHPWAMTAEEYDRFVALMRDHWGDAGDMLKFWAPTMVDNQPLRAWWARSIRLGASPNTAETWMRMCAATDVRESLSQIKVPSLILHREGDRLILPENGRYMAEHIPDSKYVELPGKDHLWWVGDQEEILEPLERFLTGTSSPPVPQRFLTTVMFTDIADSTRLAADRGDRQWKNLIEIHDQTVRELIDKYDGREIKSLGDGFLACFESPSRAIQCAQAIIEQADVIGLKVRAGLHTGECEKIGQDITGIAVNTGARIGSLADPGEILVSRTVTDLVAGSGTKFTERGQHVLDGLDGTWSLSAVAVPARYS